MGGDLDNKGKWNYMFDGAKNHTSDNNRCGAIFVWFITLLGMCVTIGSYFTQTMRYLSGNDFSYNLHDLTVTVSEFISAEPLPMVIVLSIFLLNTTFKKLYKFGKKVKPLVDNINKEEK